MANPTKRYKGKLAWLLKKYGDYKQAASAARGYAGGKTKGEKKVKIKAQFPDEFPFTSFTACVERLQGEVDDPKAHCAAWIKHAKGHWPAEASEGGNDVNEFKNIIILNDIGDSSEVEILRTGQWKHPEYGPIKVTEADIDKFIENYYNKVRGVDLAVDQAHKPDDGAAGWFKELRKDEGGKRLLAKIEWTKLGQELIKNRIYRYFSPEFTFNYKDAETGQTIRNVLFGGALTNRPFIKNMAPVLLTEEAAKEITDYEISEMKNRIYYRDNPGEKPGNEPGEKPGNDKNPKGGTKMLDELIKVLKLSEEADEQAVTEAIAKLQDDSQALDGIYKTLNLSQEADTSELLKAIEDLNTGDTQKLQEENHALNERVARLEADNKEATWEQIKGKAMSEGRLTAKQQDKFKALYLKDPEGTKAIIEELQPVVDLKEHGSNQTQETSMELFESKVAEKMQANETLSYGQAAQAIASENPDLWLQVDQERRQH